MADFEWLKDSYKIYLRTAINEAIKKIDADLKMEPAKLSPEAEEYFKARRLENIQAIKKLQQIANDPPA